MVGAKDLVPVSDCVCATVLTGVVGRNSACHAQFLYSLAREAYDQIKPSLYRGSADPEGHPRLADVVDGDLPPMRNKD